MANWKKIAVGAGIGAGVWGLITYLKRLNRTNAELESIATAQVHSLKLDGLTIRIDVQLKNPTASSFQLKFPFVKLIYKGKTIGSSQSINKDITVPAYGEAMVEDILIKIPVSGILSLGGGLLDVLSNHKTATITIKTISTIDLGWKSIPYEKTEESSLTP